MNDLMKWLALWEKCPELRPLTLAYRKPASYVQAYWTLESPESHEGYPVYEPVAAALILARAWFWLICQPVPACVIPSTPVWGDGEYVPTGEWSIHRIENGWRVGVHVEFRSWPEDSGCSFEEVASVVGTAFEPLDVIYLACCKVLGVEP